MLTYKYIFFFRYSSLNLCVVRRPTPEEMETADDPSSLDDDEAIERERQEEERMNLEAARRLNEELNGGGNGDEEGKTFCSYCCNVTDFLFCFRVLRKF